MAFSFELFVKLISPPALTSRARRAAAPIVSTARVAPAMMVVGGRRAGASMFGTAYATQRLRYPPSRLRVCFSYELRCGTDAGQAEYAALFHDRLHFT